MLNNIFSWYRYVSQLGPVYIYFSLFYWVKRTRAGGQHFTSMKVSRYGLCIQASRQLQGCDSLSTSSIKISKHRLLMFQKVGNLKYCITTNLRIYRSLLRWEDIKFETKQGTPVSYSGGSKFNYWARGSQYEGFSAFLNPSLVKVW